MPDILSEKVLVVMETTTDLIESYRILKETQNSIAEDMSTIREAIQVKIEEEGPYQDDQGYAKMLPREASTSYPAKEIKRIVDVWIDSDVPEIRTCGEMLQSYGKTKPSANYLQIR